MLRRLVGKTGAALPRQSASSAVAGPDAGVILASCVAKNSTDCIRTNCSIASSRCALPSPKAGELPHALSSRGGSRVCCSDKLSLCSYPTSSRWPGTGSQAAYTRPSLYLTSFDVSSVPVLSASKRLLYACNLHYTPTAIRRPSPPVAGIHTQVSPTRTWRTIPSNPSWASQAVPDWPPPAGSTGRRAAGPVALSSSCRWLCSHRMR